MKNHFSCRKGKTNKRLLKIYLTFTIETIGVISFLVYKVIAFFFMYFYLMFSFPQKTNFYQFVSNLLGEKYHKIKFFLEK